MPAEVDWSRYIILAVCCYAVGIRVGSCPRRDYGLHVGHRLADERYESGAFCRHIELPGVRVSRLKPYAAASGEIKIL